MAGKSQAPVLSAADREHFVKHGWIKIESAFAREKAAAMTADVWTRLGMDPNDRSTWKRGWTNMPVINTFDASEFAPRAWAAICELSGGEERILPEARTWADSWIVNLGSVENEGKHVHPKELDTWHVDGDFFVHYLDSPEQGLLVIPLFTDVVPGGGGTVICPDMIPKVAQYLYEHPEGVSPRFIPRGEAGFSGEGTRGWCLDAIQNCSSFIEATGNCGDVYLIHPFMAHCTTKNPLRQFRIITNPPISFKEPLRLDREDGKYNLVESTILQALGKERLAGWSITAPREKRIPERLKMQQAMKEEEMKRLEAEGKASIADVKLF
ncbi:hypothetical protein S40285_07209 [Stachybotrys chlorohalonatus IBT 40285]|uniref:Uncharacterized protein n=1 Tax=Stachybotrys chlorohalonatus (strain IBT 40285) TaxID=1283841 RepID=A0A084QWG8_STAC4|nr:hypothetical protein S40285_07209 [Stachybotrys chlorohalonata IBT 40285]